MDKFEAFLELADLFKQNGFSLYLVGGSVRDFLLNKELTDMDVVTDATPKMEVNFLVDLDTTFSRFGAVKLIFHEVKFDITTLRKESGYKDSRHPSEIVFTKDLKEDVYRRDFTVNALYMDKEKNVYDFVNGQEDLNNRILRCVGDAEKRIKEDPLRIYRAFRFVSDFDFVLEKSLEEAIRNNIDLVERLNKEKIKEELRKTHNQEKFSLLLKDFHLL